MKIKKLFGLIVTFSLFCSLIFPVGKFISASAEELDLADQTFVEYVKEDTGYNGEINFTNSPLYNQNLIAHGRIYSFTVAGVQGYALLVEFAGETQTLYEVTEVFYNQQSPFALCDGLPVYLTRNHYLQYKNNTFYNLKTNAILTEAQINEQASNGFNYNGLWGFEERTETINYATKETTSYYIPREIPDYVGPAESTCASTAGGILIGYYDRFYENLVPNFQTYVNFNGMIVYKNGSAETANVITQLYNLMGGELEHQGATFSEFQYAMNTYVANQGYTYSTTSVFSWGSFDFNKYQQSVQAGKPVALFLNSFALVGGFSTTDTTDTYVNHHSVTPHVVVGYGYDIYTYYDANGNEVDSKITLRIASGLATYGRCDLILEHTVINEGISVLIS